MRKLLLLILPALLPLAPAIAQVALKPWTQVYGRTPNDYLGQRVLGIMPSANLPFRAAVARTGSTSFFRLLTPADTVPQLTLPGVNPLVGDLNGDGYTDIVVNEMTVDGWDTVYVYWGTSTGIDTLNPLKIPAEFQYDELKPACIGDINNDGKPDLILSDWDFPQERTNGKIYVFLGPVIGTTADAWVVGDSVLSGLGKACAIADLNNDGYNDLIVRGTHLAGPMSSWYDYINIYWGVRNDTVNLSLGTELRGYGLASSALACFDVNGDGIADLLWTNSDSTTKRHVDIHMGGSNFSSTPALRLSVPGIAGFGNVICNAGDMNGDGYADIAVSAYLADPVSGFVFIFCGGPRIDAQFDGAVGSSDADYFGFSVSSMGDVNGDGLADIIVGAPNWQLGDARGYWGVILGDSTMKVSAVSSEPRLPRGFSLRQNYPNPFNPTTTIQYTIGGVLALSGAEGRASVNVRLVVYDILGREVAVLVNEKKMPGMYTVHFDGSGFASGIYYYRLTATSTNGTASDIQTRKMVLIK